MDITSIMGALTGAMHGVNLIKTGVATRDFAMVSAEVSKLYEQLLAAQQHLLEQGEAALAMQRQNTDLAQQVANLREKLDQKAAYELIALVGGDLVYRSLAAQPAHCVCPRCFDADGIKSVLQPRARLWCPRCNSAFGRDDSSVMITPNSGSDWRSW